MNPAEFRFTRSAVILVLVCFAGAFFAAQFRAYWADGTVILILAYVYARLTSLRKPGASAWEISARGGKE